MCDPNKDIAKESKAAFKLICNKKKQKINGFIFAKDEYF